MKRRVVVVLEVDTDDTYMMTDEFIKADLENEINCASNFYDVKLIKCLDVKELGGVYEKGINNLC